METTDTKEVKRLPVDLFSDDMPTKEVNPFADKVKEKGYTNVSDTPPPSTNGSDPSPGTPPIEPAFRESKEKAPPAAEKESETSRTSDKEFKSTPAPSQPLGDTSAIPATAEPAKTPEEIQSNASQSVKLFWRFYEMVHAFGRWVGKTDKNDLANMHLRGKIDLKFQFPLENDTISAGEFFKDANTQIDAAIQVNPKFKEEYTPAMERICIKHGWLLNDEGYVITGLIDDLSTKAGLLLGVRKSCNDVLQALVAMQEDKKKKESTKESTKSEKKSETSGTSDTSESNIPIDELWNEPGGEPGEPEEKENQGTTTT